MWTISAVKLKTEEAVPAIATFKDFLKNAISITGKNWSLSMLKMKAFDYPGWLHNSKSYKIKTSY